MSFADFFSRIRSPTLRQIASHWLEARGGGRLPGWKAIDPAAMAPHLSIIWSWRFDRDSGRFTGRLAGEAITEAFGRQMRGVELHDFFAGRNPDDVAARYRRIVDEVALMHCTGRVFKHAGRVGLGERIAMPLAEDGRTPDGILGATTYSVAEGAHPDAPGAERFDQQHCEFYAADAARAG